MCGSFTVTDMMLHRCQPVVQMSECQLCVTDTVGVCQPAGCAASDWQHVIG